MKTLYHNNVAKEAFEKYLTPRAMDWLIRGNFNTDFYGSLGWKILEKKVPLGFLGRKWYNSIDHLDQCPDYEKLHADWSELRRRLDECADDTKYPPKQIKKLLIALGRVSHSLTDLYAHSTYVELLYEYYRNDPAAAMQVESSGLTLPDFIAKTGPMFSEVADDSDGKYQVFMEQYLKPKVFSDECIPDVGPRSHAEMAKDAPGSKMSQHPDYPEIFKVVMALAHREVVSLIRNFFEELKRANPEKFEKLVAAMPGNMQGPGVFERRSMFWSAKFGGSE